ncbi:MAG: TrmB family transcriptional regulator [Candidatus Aenigmarchaeota archaeon]|nr:TrmB family transcriptional regulator [Candidatus Aenigmarchaeota archaeon]
MIGSNKVLDSLKNIGLNLYERKIYIALLAKGVASAAIVSEISGVPRSRSYDVLQSLSEKGFVVMQPSKPIKYVALAPIEAMERTKQNMEKKHKEMVARIDDIKASGTMEELKTIHKEGLSMIQPYEMTGTLKGSNIINRQLKSVFKEAQKTISIATTETGLEKLHLNHFRVLKKMSKNGVKIKIAAPFSDKKIANDFSSVAEIKNVKDGKGRVYTVDDKHIIMSLSDDNKVHETQDVMFWANSEHAVKNLGDSVFTQIWKSASNLVE